MVWKLLGEDITKGIEFSLDGQIFELIASLEQLPFFVMFEAMRNSAVRGGDSLQKPERIIGKDESYPIGQCLGGYFAISSIAITCGSGVGCSMSSSAPFCL